MRRDLYSQTSDLYATAGMVRYLVEGNSIKSRIALAILFVEIFRLCLVKGLEMHRNSMTQYDHSLLTSFQIQHFYSELWMLGQRVELV